MDEISELVRRAQRNDRAAFDALVLRFQNMAVGYAYSILGDLQRAQDAAQEAFLQAFFDLPTLREPGAFAGWLRRIVFKHCDRQTRRAALSTVPLDTAWEVANADEPAVLSERAALQHEVRAAINALPPTERVATALFYIGDYSQQEIAAFLEVPVTTVKKRLQSARARLKERLITMVQENLHEQAPSRDARFTQQVRAAVDAVIGGDVPALADLLRTQPELANARSPDGRTLLNHLADWPGHRPASAEALRLLLDAGADVNARAIDPERGETPLQWAVSSNDVGLAERLLDAGASVDGIDGDRRPLAQALFYRQADAVALLVRRGATIDLELAAGLGRVDLLAQFFDAQGNLLPEAGVHHPPVNNPRPSASADPRDELREQAMIYAVINGQIPAIQFLLDQGAQINAMPAGFDEQATPLHWAVAKRHALVAELLVRHGADLNAHDMRYHSTPLGWAEHLGHADMAELLRRLMSER